MQKILFLHISSVDTNDNEEMAKSAFNIFCHVFQNVFTYTNHSMKHPFLVPSGLVARTLLAARHNHSLQPLT